MTSATPGTPAGDEADGRPPLRDVVPQWPVTAGDVVAASSDGTDDPDDPDGTGADDDRPAADDPGADQAMTAAPSRERRRRPWSRESAVPAPPSPRPPARFRVVRLVAGLVAAVGLLVSVLLAAGALAVALGMDTDTGWGEQLASACDLLAGPLHGLFEFSGEHGEVRETLAAWGLASLVALVGGRLAAWLVARLA